MATVMGERALCSIIVKRRAEPRILERQGLDAIERQQVAQAAEYDKRCRDCSNCAVGAGHAGRNVCVRRGASEVGCGTRAESTAISRQENLRCRMRPLPRTVFFPRQEGA